MAASVPTTTRRATPRTRAATDGPGLTVTIEARPAYETLMALATVVERDEERVFEIGPEWIVKVREAAGADLLDAIDRLAAHCGWVFGNILGLAIDTPEPRDVAAFVRHLESLEARDIHLALVGHTLRPFRRVTPPEVMVKAIDGDAEARRAFMRSSFADHPSWPEALRRLLRLTSAEAKSLLLDVIRGFDERVFEDEGPALIAVAERDAAEKRALLATRSPAEVVDVATRGWDYVPEPGVTRIILAPTVVQRPFNTTADHHDTRIFCYAVGDESLAAGSADPPAFLVRGLKALADERRLRILRLLRDERRTLQELADEFQLPKTTIHHHLAMLRAAGFIHLRDEPGRQYSPYPRYTYRAEAVPRAMEALAAYLKTED